MQQHTSLHELPDERLIEFFLDRQDQRILSVLYQRYSKVIYRKCLAIVWDTDQAQDLTHDTFVKAFLHLKSLKEARYFKTWLYRIAYNLCIDFLKQKNKLQFEEDWQQFDVVEDRDEYDEKVLLESNLKQLEHALQQLNETDRLILIMRYYDGMSLKAIQSMLKINESAVKMRLLRARQRLSKVIEHGQAKGKAN